MKSIDTYSNLCTQVYDLDKPEVLEKAYCFYKPYLKDARGPILEPMCGTGRFLLPFLRDGFGIEGFDASSHMLNALHKKAKALGLRPNVWQGFAEQPMNREEIYDLIFIPSGSFGLLIDEATAIKALKNFHSILNNNGIFIFEAETLKAMPSQFGTSRSSAYKSQDGNMIVATFFDTPSKDNIGNCICRYDLVKDNQVTRTEIEELKTKFYTPESLILMLKNIGFSEVILHKAFDKKTSPDSDDEVIIYECRK